MSSRRRSLMLRRRVSRDRHSDARALGRRRAPAAVDTQGARPPGGGFREPWSPPLGPRAATATAAPNPPAPLRRRAGSDASAVLAPPPGVTGRRPERRDASAPGQATRGEPSGAARSRGPRPSLRPDETAAATPR